MFIYFLLKSWGTTRANALVSTLVENSESTSCNLLEVGFSRESDFKLPLRNLLGRGESSFRFSCYIKVVFVFLFYLMLNITFFFSLLGYVHGLPKWV